MPDYSNDFHGLFADLFVDFHPLDAVFGVLTLIAVIAAIANFQTLSAWLILCFYSASQFLLGLLGLCLAGSLLMRLVFGGFRRW